MSENLLSESHGIKLTIDDSYGDLATPEDVLEGVDFSNGTSSFIGTRKVEVTDKFFSTVYSSGVSGTVPGEILCAVSIPPFGQQAMASEVSISGNSFSFRCTNSAYYLSNVTLRIAYLIT